MPREQLSEKPWFTNSRTKSGCWIQTVEGEGGGGKGCCQSKSQLSPRQQHRQSAEPQQLTQRWQLECGPGSGRRRQVPWGGEGNGPSNKDSQVSASLWH